MRTIFLDCDGVLADFDRHYEACFGPKPDKTKPEPPDFWTRVAGHPSFYADLPLMSDADELVGGVIVLGFTPILLTGVPSSIKTASAQKQTWRARHFPSLTMITCFSRDKFKHMKAPGDILIDDWEKHRSTWESHGGVWIPHTSAAASLARLKELV